MTAAATGPRPTVHRPARGPVVRTALNLLAYFWRAAGWFWAILVVLAVAATLLIDRLGAIEASTLWYARQAGIWFPFSVLVGVALAYLPVHVAGGMTRRSYVRGSLLAAVGMAGSFALVATGLLALERLVFDSAGWAWRLADGWSAADSGLWAVGLGLFVTYLVADLSGLLVGSVYAVGGAWWGTLTLPLTAGPVLLMMVLMSGSTAGLPIEDWFSGGPGTVPLPALLLAGVVLAAALSVAFQMLSVRRSIAPRRG